MKFNFVFHRFSEKIKQNSSASWLRVFQECELCWAEHDNDDEGTNKWLKLLNDQYVCFFHVLLVNVIFAFFFVCLKFTLSSLPNRESLPPFSAYFLS